MSWEKPVQGAVRTAGRQALKNPRLFDLWRELGQRLRGRRIAVVGAPGVGKSVLVDYLSGKGYEPDYAPPGRSFRRERGLVREDTRLALVVAPGDPSPIQQKTLEECFDPKRPVQGVVFVTADGFGEQRTEAGAVTDPIRSGVTIETFRNTRRQLDLDFFRDDLVRRFHESHKGSRAPSWLILVRAKMDLEPMSEQAWLDAHQPGGDAPLATALDALRHDVGGLYFE